MYDLGGAWERTAMSWQRTALLLGVNGVLVVKVGTSGHPWLVPVGVLVSLCALGLWAGVSRVYGRHRGDPQPHFLLRPARSRRWLAALLGVAAIACTAVVVGVL